MPTIKTCFDCFGTRSSDAKKNTKTTKEPRKIKIYAISINFVPPPGGEGPEGGGVSKMGRVPEGEFLSTASNGGMKKQQEKFIFQVKAYRK